jgi:sucrose phosphorylase
MSRSFSSQILERLHGRLEKLYGDQAERCLERLSMMVGRYGVGSVKRSVTASRWDQRDALLITYGDILQAPGEKPLATLKCFLDQRLKDTFNSVHVLPFFPYSSDDGFSVIHFRNVNPELGDWPAIQALGENFRLAFDLVLNHVSRQSGWFQDYQAGVAPGRHYFIAVEPGADVSAVVRPRSLPLLTAVTTPAGKHMVWTTFSDDQIDLNFANPDVLFEMLDILLFYVSMGARVIRLDAIAYLWKRIGTPCIHLPETHEIVKLFRDFLEIVAPDVVLLTETNVPQEENYSYFGAGDEAHAAYQFALPPLLLHALQSGTTKYLTAWATALPVLPTGSAVLNFTASHDGIGVRPLQGVLPDEEIRTLVERVQTLGAQVSTRKNSDGSDSPYELNITYFDAMRGNGDPDPLHVQRFMCSQTIPMVLKGIPAVYFHSLTATPNDMEGVKRTGRARSINRRKWTRTELDDALKDKSSNAARVFGEYTRLLQLRAGHAAFHPDGAQKILNLGENVFAVERTSPAGKETILAISNCTGQPVHVPIAERDRTDLILTKKPEMVGNAIRLDPYQSVWLT